MHGFHSALGVATTLCPVDPLMLVRPHAARRAARFFLDRFPGRTLYAVKANPCPDLLRTLWSEGVTHYDVASIGEVRLVRSVLPDAVLCFMHPVKPESAIAEAYALHGVRVFSLDSHDELAKIVRATGGARDLTLCVRLRAGSDHAKLSLANKFGADPADAPSLLMATRQAADRLGICFHVGSQTMSPDAYVATLNDLRAVIVASSVTVDVIDVGGGFPSIYPGMEPAPMVAYFDAIHMAFEDLPVSYSAELWAEPGRALAAEYASVLLRVEARRGNQLFVNDGAYGALFDAAHLGWRFPARLVRAEPSAATEIGFSLWGPTCDDLDHMAGPFLLPIDVDAGDYVEIGMIGAYGAAMRTGFNGFSAGEAVVVADEPMASAYALPANAAPGRVIGL